MPTITDGTYVLAAAQWILLYGQSLFKQVRFAGEVSGEDLRRWSPGPKYKGGAELTLRRWRFWRDRYKAIASSSEEDEQRYGEECKNVATKAAALMDALEKNMTP